MKLFLALLFTGIISSGSYAQVALPAPSPTQTIRQDFGLGKIDLTYSRPSIKDRPLFKENSDLAPFGKLWRTGANGATKIKFSDKVMLGGTSIDTGTYVLYTIPNKKEWEIILNKGLTNWGIDGYKESDDVVRFKVPSLDLKDKVETFTMLFANIQPENVDLNLMWGNTAVRIPISTNVKDRIRTQIENALKGEKKPYQQAANFYYEYEKDYKSAFDNINKAIDVNPKSPGLYILKAKIQRDMGDKAGAKVSAAKTIELATAAKNAEYIKQGNDFLKNK